MEDIISQVLEAEKKASEIIKEAENEGDKIINDAKSEALKIKEQILSEARIKKEEIISLGNEKAKEVFEVRLNSYKSEAKDIKDRAKLSYEKAVSFVLERVVSR